MLVSVIGAEKNCRFYRHQIAYAVERRTGVSAAMEAAEFWAPQTTKLPLLESATLSGLDAIKRRTKNSFFGR
ncbi:MAG: hypothetical protein EON58_08885 [Alphaproteobacteria bacterium]|nr:MAG: hypothetical protein EON58_08885 [Alphaproteobacteria bacterium]